MSTTKKFKKAVSAILDRDNLFLKEALIILLVLIGILFVIVYGSFTNIHEVENQMQQNLADVSKQNALMLESKISSEYELLDSLSKELEGVTPETIDARLAHFNIFINNFDLKRFAYCFPDGTTYSTDGDITDLSYRDFYLAGMDGENFITGVLTDAITKDNTSVNVITKPVYDSNGDIQGVFGLAFDTVAFNNFLQIDSFDGAGYSCIINDTYEIMAATDGKGLSLSHNFIDELTASDNRNEEAVNILKNAVEHSSESSGTIWLSGMHYYYSVPVSLVDSSVTWHVLTIIPSSILRQKISSLQSNQLLITSLILILVFSGALFIFFLIKERHEKMISFAYEDPLTKGANYTSFCTSIQTGERNGYIISMDIANFNYITVVAGENAGNEMIKKTWNILRNSLNKNELAAHIRDEIFILYLDDIDENRLIPRMEKISQRISDLAKDFLVHGICARYGLCRMNPDESFENTYGKARIAKEYTLIKPNSHHAFYNNIDESKLQREKQLEEMFPAAIKYKDFQVWFQPKYNAKTCEIVGSEALVRWIPKGKSMISPGEFIPLFERNGMIVQLDEYMFNEVCRQQKKWLEEGRKIYPVSVNISRASLYSMDVEKHYNEILKKYNIPPEYIQLEITETAMEAKKDIYDLLNRFRQMGIKILMDDFGSGYSSLATLSTQCFDTLKIDKTLIDHIGNKDGETILYHIIRMGQQMGLHITAEGVEKKNQLEFLQNLNCDDIQGFYFAKPMPSLEYEAFLP